jgi:hypothetical protein
MKKLILLTAFTLTTSLAFADGHLINHNGFLYWVESDGSWYYKGQTPKNWKGQQQYYSPDTTADILKDIEQAERDQVQRDIESDLSDIASALQRNR